MAYDPFSDARAQIDDGLGLRSQRMRQPSAPAMPQPPVQGQIGMSSYNMPAGAPGPSQYPQPMAGRFGGVNGSVSAPVGPGTLDVSGGVTPQAGLAHLGARYNVGPVTVGAQYQPGAGVRGNVEFRQPFQEGGLATSLPGAFETRQNDMDFIHDRYSQMHEVAGKPHFARGGAVWTRKEGQNPEGGLNAKGRASLKAQGHDIKPPVSAKQAKKSPKAAARRSSFCARMGGMEGPMKDGKGRPTRKALALRKWDC